MTVDLPERILEYLTSHDGVNSSVLAEVLREDHQKIVGAIKSLQSLGNVITATQKSDKSFKLTAEGEEIVKHGSHEARVYNALTDDGLPQSAVMSIFPHAKVGFSKAMSLGWISVDKKADGGPRIKKKLESIVDNVQDDLKRLFNGGGGDTVAEAVKQDLKKRKLLQEIAVTTYDVSKGSDFTTSVEKPETDLTAEMIASGSWKSKTFKEYNFDALGIPPTRGHLHPLMKVRAEFRQIFLEMGFTEMPTNNYIESSFWCFDALFVPQQHPARDEQDTFFIADPATTEDLPEQYVEAVRKVHSEGDYGSTGYNYEWKLEEAKKNVLRTHTTAVSARMLTALGKEDKFRPVKWFSMDRVFRNETLDATHLAEFIQIEGVVADYGITLGAHMGIIGEFFKKLGMDKIRFKPTFNPYTEPSMEIFGYHDGLKKWVEVGNSGVFRPEMIRPMGIPEGVQVLGWGLSVERPTMIKYGINNIRDLVGHKMNLQMVHEHPVVRLDKNESSGNRQFSKDPSSSGNEDNLSKELWSLRERQERIIHDVLSLSRQVDDLLTKNQGITPSGSRAAESVSLVISASPQHPPFGVTLFASLLDASITSHHQSSIKNPPKELASFFKPCSNNSSRESSIHLTLIWKDNSVEPQMMVDPLTQVPLEGEANILRYLCRVLESKGSCPVLYEKKGPEVACVIDFLVDTVNSNLLNGSKKCQQAELHRVDGRLKNHRWLVDDNSLSLADVFLWSVLKQTDSLQVSCVGIQRWLRDLKGKLGYFRNGL